MRQRATTKEVIQRLELLEQGLKFCKNCQQTKAVTEFAQDTRHTDGLQTYCRKCCNLLRRTKYGDAVRQHARDYAKTHKTPKTTRIITEKQCSRCGEVKSISEFGPDKRKPDGYQSQCRKCQAFVRQVLNREKTLAAKKKRHQKNKERDNADAKKRMKEWVRNNPGRHRANCERRRGRKISADGPYTLKQWQRLLLLCDFKCLKCGSLDNIEADHIIPLSKDGSNMIDNIQPLCKPCNRSKHDTIADYRPSHIQQWAALQVAA